MISYILDDCHLSGGAKVVLEHVAGLIERGHEARVLYRTGSTEWFGRAVPTRRIQPSDLVNVRGIKVATWCDTANWVAASLRDGDRGFYLVQDMDEETYIGRIQPVTYSLGLKHIVEGRWVERQLQERWHVETHQVGIGTRFQRVAIARAPKRIFAQFRTGYNNLKGWPLTAEVVKLAYEMDNEISLVTFGMKQGMCVAPHIPQIHIRFPSDKKLAELYSQAGMFLFTSRHEGFGLPCLEAMACGCPVVCTNADGNSEFCINGETALVRSTAKELAAACVQVVNDAVRWAGLSVAGSMLVERYRWPAVIDKLEALYA